MEINKIKTCLYESMTSTEGKEITIENYIGLVQYGANQDAVIQARKAKQEGDLETYKKIKSNSKVVTPTGIFENGQKKIKANLIPNGLVCIDIDDELSDEQVHAIYNDKYSFIVHKSFGGDGYCVFVKIDPTKIDDAYDAISKYYYDNYKISTDQACKNSNRLRYLSYDPDILVVTSASKFNVRIKKEDKAPSNTNYIFTNSDFENIIRQIEERSIDLVKGDYYRYIRIGFALYSQFGENEGGKYFEIINRYNPNLNKKKAAREWKALCKPGDVKIGTFYYYCKEEGIEVYTERTKTIINRVKVSKSQGNPTVESVVMNLEQANNIIANEEDKKLISQLIDSPVDFSKNSNEGLTQIEQLINFIIDSYDPTRDVLTQTVYIKGNTILTDVEAEDIYLECKKNFDFSVSSKDVNSILGSNKVRKVNSLQDFIDDNKDLKPVGVIDSYIDCIYPQSDYNRWAFKKWIVGAMHNWLSDIDETLVSPLTLVLTGQDHGIGKCLAKDTPILMYDGTIKMVQDVCVNDKLMGDDGSPRRVLSLARGKEMMYRIDQSRAMSYTVNESHILSFKNRRTHETVNISVKDYMKLNKTTKENLVGYRGFIKNEVDSELPIEPRFLGLWLGDGSTNVKKYGVCVENMDNEVISYIYKYAESIGHHVSINENKKSKSNGYRLVKNKGRGVGKWNDDNHIKTKMISMGLSNLKHIPDIYKFSSRKQRLELLAGIIDSDGSKNSACSFEVTQKSRILADDIAFLCRSLGFRCTIKDKVINNKTYYRMNISGNLKDVPVLLERKRVNKVNSYSSVYSKKTVTKLSEGDYYGFEIDGNKLFMLGDFTVTHNTSFFRNILPKQLYRYFVESKISGKNKDAKFRMCTNLIMLDDEFGGNAFKDQKEFKDISDKNIITDRLSYGKRDVTWKRRAALAGTCNELDVLKDVTGNRRILPINVTKIDYDKLISIDKESLIMEAYHLLKDGFDWKIYKAEDRQYIADNTQQNQAILPVEEIFFNHFSLEYSIDTPQRVVFNQGEILEYLNKVSLLKPTSYQLKEIIVKNKMSYSTFRVGQKTKKGFELYMSQADFNDQPPF